ncbi:hypothetical protein PV08_10503 [Exophiala spinifera]|uniref:Uncharacterized protein n=1 Tax=Exophiala spinifera TaxID=91928 RepID=A0A0D2AWX1_9EURO|nr:uncharacterized protein PV08_10503 [Exophiala spinifera]KIW11203.1 hypothetical protein PV08_10503 [Exophiala spinifera]
MNRPPSVPDARGTEQTAYTRNGSDSVDALSSGLATSDGGFVYSSNHLTATAPATPSNTEASSTPDNSFSSSRQQLSLMQSAQAPSRSGLDLTVPISVDPLSFMASNNRHLLQYFMHNASQALATHSLVHREVCEVIIPMAVANPALLHATLALAAIHLNSFMSNSDHRPRDEGSDVVAHLTTTSIAHLRRELQQPVGGSPGPQLATIRTLFLCEAISGSPTLSTWRSHFLGAKALFSSMERQKDIREFQKDASLPFLRRWYNITEALVALTPEGLEEDMQGSLGPRSLGDPSDTPICIDAYTGCTDDLAKALREIGALAWERRRATRPPNQPSKLSEADFLRKADGLEILINRMIIRDRSGTAISNVPEPHGLSLKQFEEFLLCNEAYQHTALIHIHRQIRLLSSDSSLVQDCVKRIIDCVSRIKPAATLSPLTLLTTPLFTAGCEARGSDRTKITLLLKEMYNHLHLPNMKQALEVLEDFWLASADGKTSWESFSSTLTLSSH